MFDILDVEDDAEGENGQDGGPEAEVASPYAFVVLDLEGSLQRRCADEDAYRDLPQQQYYQRLLFGILVGCSVEIAYQLCVEVPILLHRLCRAIPEQMPQGPCTPNDARRGHHSNPDIEEAGRKVISVRTDRTPSLTTTA